MKNCGVYAFPICYNNNCQNGQSPVQMGHMANYNGGKYFEAKTAGELALAFDEIYELINQLVPDNTKMMVSFDNIEINKTYTEADGSKVYDYIPHNIPVGLTVGEMSAPSATINPNARTSIIWPNGTQSIQNQSEQWPYLIFTVGKVTLQHEWSTTFSLKAKQSGCYNLFGPGSVLDFGDGSVPMDLPDSPICVNTTVNDTGVLQGTLDISNLHTVSSGPFADFVPLQWNTYYNGTKNTNFATEKIYYNIAGGPWVQFNTISVPSADYVQLTPLLSPLQFDVRGIPRGSTINIWVHASAPDANDDNEYLIFNFDWKFHPPVYNPEIIFLKTESRIQ